MSASKFCKHFFTISVDNFGEKLQETLPKPENTGHSYRSLTFCTAHIFIQLNQPVSMFAIVYFHSEYFLYRRKPLSNLALRQLVDFSYLICHIFGSFGFKYSEKNSRYYNKIV